MNKYSAYASKVRRFLNNYAEWRDQLEEISDNLRGIDYSATRVQGGGDGGTGGSTLALVVRRDELQGRVAVVEEMLSSLSDAERVLAAWYITPGTTKESIAKQLDIGPNVADGLIWAIPTILAMRCTHLFQNSH